MLSREILCDFLSHLTRPAANNDTEQGQEQQLVFPEKHSKYVSLHTLLKSPEISIQASASSKQNQLKKCSLLKNPLTTPTTNLTIYIYHAQIGLIPRTPLYKPDPKINRKEYIQKFNGSGLAIIETK